MNAKWPVKRLGEIVEQMQPGFACRPTEASTGVAQLRPLNIKADGTLVFDGTKAVPASPSQRARYRLLPGDVLFNNTNSPDLVGKTCLFNACGEYVYSNHLTRVRVRSSYALPEFIHRLLSGLWQVRYFRRLCTQWVNQAAINVQELSAVLVPLPPLPEQRRIAAILDEAENLRRLRAAADGRTADLIPALFHEMFHDPSMTLPRPRLAEVAKVVSGLAKGRRFGSRETVRAPYLRVANVQAGFLDLTEIKEIEALPSEVQELALKHGDVLLTEGGDHDKLGRGAMWDAAIPNCIHQNHVFRVRTQPSQLDPVYLTNYLLTPQARGYFLRCAKRTTNLASINMTQLRNLPVLLPSLFHQQQFAAVAEQIRAVQEKQSASRRRLDDLSQSLLHRAFTGEL